MKKVLIIIPAYNEASNIVRTVETVKEKCPKFDYIVINDGSQDDTLEICVRKGYEVINLPVNIGLAGAIRAGMKYAKYKNYDYAIQIDGDGQHNPEFIEMLIEYGENNNSDIVIGSRYVTKRKPWNARMLGGAYH